MDSQWSFKKGAQHFSESLMKKVNLWGKVTLSVTHYCVGIKLYENGDRFEGMFVNGVR